MSSKVISEVRPEERFSVDEANDEKAVLQKGGTANDEREMTRMGKKQELRVSYEQTRQSNAVLTMSSATSSLSVSSAS